MNDQLLPLPSARAARVNLPPNPISLLLSQQSSVFVRLSLFSKRIEASTLCFPAHRNGEPCSGPSAQGIRDVEMRSLIYRGHLR